MILSFRKETKNIVFIFGSPRGGTTWLWSLLESNEGTIPFLDNANQKIDGSYSSSESGVYIRDRKNAKKRIYAFAKKHENRIVIEKTPMHTLMYDKILKDFPKSKFIVLFRHPLAIVNSMVSSEMDAFKNHDLNYSIVEVKKYYAKLEELVNREKAIILSYENLHSKTKLVLFEIFELLKLNTNDIDEIIKNNNLKSPINVKGVLRKGLIDSYKTDLTKAQQEKIEIELEHEISLFNKIKNNSLE